jgi:hypothetical protein
MVRYLDDFVVCFQYHTDAVGSVRKLVSTTQSHDMTGENGRYDTKESDVYYQA